MKLGFLKVLVPSCVGSTGAVVGGIHLGTVDTFEGHLKDHCIPKGIQEGATSAWKKAEDVFSSDNGTEVTFSPFKEAKEKLKDSSQSGSSNGKILKEACEDVYSWRHSTIFTTHGNLFPIVKKYCHTTIKSMMSTGQYYLESDKSGLGTNVESKIGKANATSKLTKEFERIKNSKTKNSEGEKFYEECKRLYDSPFLGESSNDWKLVQDYCLKTSG